MEDITRSGFPSQMLLKTESSFLLLQKTTCILTLFILRKDGFFTSKLQFISLTNVFRVRDL